MIKTLTMLVSGWQEIAPAMEQMLASHKGLLAFDHCITPIQEPGCKTKFLVTVIVQLPKK